MMQPYLFSSFVLFWISPTGIATHTQYSGRTRQIFDNAIKLIKLAGQGAWLSKTKISDAFKIVPIHLS